MSQDLITCWRASDGDTEPQERKCREFRIGERTESGEKINQHYYADIGEAWPAIHYSKDVASPLRDRQVYLQRKGGAS